MASEIDFILLENFMKVLLFVSVHIIVFNVLLDAYDHIKQNKFKYRIMVILFHFFFYTYAIDYPILFGDENFITQALTPNFIETYYEKMFFLLFVWTALYISYAVIMLVFAMYVLVTMKR